MEIHIQPLTGNLSGVIDIRKADYNFWTAGFIEGAEENLGSSHTSYINLLNQSSEFLEKDLKVGSYIDGMKISSSGPNPTTVCFDGNSYFGAAYSWSGYHRTFRPVITN